MRTFLDYLRSHKQFQNYIYDHSALITRCFELADLWIETYTGKQFHFAAASPDFMRDSIDIADIAHGLATTNRFCGHAKHPWSVACHSVLVKEILSDLRLLGYEHKSYTICSSTTPEKLQLAALLHDAHEAYLHDLTRPLKRILRSSLQSNNIQIYDLLSSYIQECIDEKFNSVIGPISARRLFQEADNAALLLEAHVLMPSRGLGWCSSSNIQSEISIQRLLDAGIHRHINDYRWQESKKVFLYHFHQL